MFQFCCYIFHFVFCKRIHADEHHTQDSTYGRQEAQEHLDTANRFFTLHCVCLEAKESEQPTGYRRTDSPTEFLAHGRRGEYQSYCIFIQGSDEETTSKRLDILNKSNDGFYIAGEDLKLRGPGDLFGIRQSGDMEFRIGDIYNDSAILKSASEAAAEILSLDPDLSLEQHRALKHYLLKRQENASDGLGL